MGDPVEVHLPEFRDMSVMEHGDLVKPKRLPNVRQLFMHTAGIGKTSMGAHKAWPAEDGSLTPPASLEEHVKRIAAAPLAHHPGDRWDYSSCHVVLGRLVEVWSGVALSDFLQREIFRPLGMDDTGFSVPTGKRERVPRNYEATGSGQTLVDVTADTTWFFGDELHWHRLSPSGGLAGTLEDYWRFCQCLLDNLRGETFRGVRLLSRKTLELMVRNHSRTEQQPVGGAPGVGFGLGVAVCVDARQSASLASEGEVYWGGNASTYFWIDPREGVVCVFLSQVMPGNFYPLESKLRTMVNQAIVGPPPSKRSKLCS
jgi:CubicO group peptidase (beta-lactamase class C family)